MRFSDQPSLRFDVEPCAGKIEVFATTVEEQGFQEPLKLSIKVDGVVVAHEDVIDTQLEKNIFMMVIHCTKMKVEVTLGPSE